MRADVPPNRSPVHEHAARPRGQRGQAPDGYYMPFNVAWSLGMEIYEVVIGDSELAGTMGASDVQACVPPELPEREQSLRDVVACPAAAPSNEDV